MLRLFLVLASVLLLLGVSAELAPTSLVEVAAEDDCHCCPDGDEGEGDCCDWDFGACCGSSMAVALPGARIDPTERAVARPETHALVPLHLLLPRDNGPPPHPPPIG
jgi:hypothetical protein